MRSQGRSRVSALQLITLRSTRFVFWLPSSLFICSACCNGQISFIIYPSVFSVEGLPVSGLNLSKVLKLAVDDTKAPQVTPGNLGRSCPALTALVGSRAGEQSGSGHTGQGMCCEFKPLLMLPGRWEKYFPEGQELRNHSAMQSQG